MSDNRAAQRIQVIKQQVFGGTSSQPQASLDDSKDTRMQSSFPSADTIRSIHAQLCSPPSEGEQLVRKPPSVKVGDVEVPAVGRLRDLPQELQDALLATIPSKSTE
jgi:hypothetical protein